MSVRRCMLVCVIVPGLAWLARADAPAAPKNHPARDYAQACSHPDNPRLEAPLRAAFEQQMQSLAAPGHSPPADFELRRAMCEVALWRLETGAGALSLPLSHPVEPTAIQSAAGAVEERLGSLETDLRQVRNTIRGTASTEAHPKKPGEIEIVAGIAGLALCISIVSVFLAHWTARRALRAAGLR